MAFRYKKWKQINRWHLIVNNNEYVSIKNDDIEVENRGCKKLLEIKVHSKSQFYASLK